jgi:hypothetical protein
MEYDPFHSLTPLFPLGIFRLCATDENVVEGDVDELDDVADGTHDYCALLAI